MTGVMDTSGNTGACPVSWCHACSTGNEHVTRVCRLHAHTSWKAHLSQERHGLERKQPAAASPRRGRPRTPRAHPHHALSCFPDLGSRNPPRDQEGAAHGRAPRHPRSRQHPQVTTPGSDPPWVRAQGPASPLGPLVLCPQPDLLSRPAAVGWACTCSPPPWGLKAGAALLPLSPASQALMDADPTRWWCPLSPQG